MVWSKIKKAINSTLGTSGFKPLNEIVTESFSHVVEKQNEMKASLESGENNYVVNYAKMSSSIETGSYRGTASYGEDAKNTLTFMFVPKIVIITSTQPDECQPLILIHGVNRAFAIGTYNYVTDVPSPYWYDLNIEWDDDGKSVSWYGTWGAWEQLNAKPSFEGDNYFYFAAGSEV